jgi:hypothetical protein
MVGEFKLEANQAANCSTISQDQSGGLSATFASHYNEVDDPNDTHLGLFGFTSAGVRIAALRDPAHPKEIAYYIPGANPGATLQFGMGHASLFYFDDTYLNAVGSHIRYRKDNGQIWFVSQTGGFHIIELEPQARAAAGLPSLPAALPSQAGGVGIEGAVQPALLALDTLGLIGVILFLVLIGRRRRSS